LKYLNFNNSDNLDSNGLKQNKGDLGFSRENPLDDVRFEFVI